MCVRMCVCGVCMDEIRSCESTGGSLCEFCVVCLL